MTAPTVLSCTHRFRTGVSKVQSVPASRHNLQVISPLEDGASSSHFILRSLHPCLSASIDAPKSCLSFHSGARRVNEQFAQSYIPEC